MPEKPLSEIADFLEIFVPKEVKIKVPESVQCKSVALQVEKKTMKEIISDLGLELSGKQITMTPVENS
jgi:wyosine [tRNA(Phe)-imidazoG37] synthetase (radical SAM superfamily)